LTHYPHSAPVYAGYRHHPASASPTSCASFSGSLRSAAEAPSCTIRPLLMITVRSEKASATRLFCSTRMIESALLLRRQTPFAFPGFLGCGPVAGAQCARVQSGTGDVPERAVRFGVSFAAVAAEVLEGAVVHAQQHAPLPPDIERELQDDDQVADAASDAGETASAP
jgi:hypothetical protein